MTQEDIRTYWPIALAVVNLVFILAAFVLHKTFATKDDTNEIKQEQARLRQDFNLLESQVGQLPSATEVANLRVSMETLHGDIKEMRPQLKSLQRMSDLLLENELKERNNGNG